ncbi:MAG: hypothetical protein R3C01_03670 [Planctomycetaceae bacterium]
MAGSANLDFFAVEEDQEAILSFLFSQTDVRVFEAYSEFGTDLREFRTTEEVSAAYPLGIDLHGNGHAVLLKLWSPSVMEQLSIRRIALNPESCNGHTFRYCIDGGGLMQLYFGGVCERVVTLSHFGHQSQVRAEKWDVDQGVKWPVLKKLSNRIVYHIRKRLGVAKVPGRPVLAKAYELAKSGYALKLATQTPWEYELQ